ncbi:MAG: UDP-glucose 6-dehydrogenase, partial [Burkholderiales bacterium]|nr:UDP-glucose 6-dehydrogenase [Burkholderiales bacterium]
KRVLALDFEGDAHLVENIRFADSEMQALDNADALIIVTEWKLFRQTDLVQVKAALKQAIIFDGRNLFDPRTVQQAGLEYHAMGRAVLTQSVS